MDRLKFNNVPSPEEVIGKEILSSGQEKITIPDGHDLDGIALSIYIYEMKKLQKDETGNFSEQQKAVALEYVDYLLKAKIIRESKPAQEAQTLIVKSIVEFKQNIAQLQEKIDILNRQLEEQKHKINAEQVTIGKAGIGTLHFDDIEYLKGNLRKKAEHIQIMLKSKTTDEIDAKYKLSSKSFGYRYLILLGENQIELKGTHTR